MFQSNSWVEHHLRPLALAASCRSVTLVATTPIAPMDKVSVVQPPRWLVRVGRIGRGPAAGVRRACPAPPAAHRRRLPSAVQRPGGGARGAPGRSAFAVFLRRRACRSARRRHPGREQTLQQVSKPPIPSSKGSWSAPRHPSTPSSRWARRGRVPARTGRARRHPRDSRRPGPDDVSAVDSAARNRRDVCRAPRADQASGAAARRHPARCGSSTRHSGHDRRGRRASRGARRAISRLGLDLERHIRRATGRTFANLLPRARRSSSHPRPKASRSR